MKLICIISFLLLLQGCSSSTDDNTSDGLIGLWQSNCYELTPGNTPEYTITILDITNDSYKQTGTLYSDINCANTVGTTSDLIKTYITLGQVMTTDGVNAQRLRLFTVRDIYQNPITITTDLVFRITGIDLNFGVYQNGLTPSLDYAITYVKQ